jgi:hypothetical protein
MKIQWTTQNEAVDAEGALLEGAASFAAELKLLKSMGCPDTNRARLIEVEVTGWDESLTSAVVTAKMARWLFTEIDAEQVGQAA